MQAMKNEIIVFLDWMRAAACFMVMAIHSTEPFYLGGAEPNVTHIASSWDMMWITATFLCSPLVAILVRRIPVVGKLICG